MARKKDVVKKIDIKTKASGAPLPLIQEDQIAPPAFYVIPAPDSLHEVSQAIQRSTQAPLVMVAIAWNEAPNIAPDYYNVEYSEFADFSQSQRRRANSTSATIDGLKANDVTYYFRVQAVMGGIYSEWSNTLSVNTIHDDTPPPDVTDASAAFQNSDLVITYTIPESEILKDVEIKIYNAARTILYGTFYPTTNRFVWTAEQNIFATGGNPLKSVSIDIKTRSWTNEYSLAGVTISATAPLPATPTGYTSNWISDTGVSDEDFVTAWVAALNADSYDVTVDGRLFNTKDTRFTYRYDQNVKDHVPTLASGDSSFIWLLQSRDKLGQVSTPVNVTVTNAAPPNGVMQISTVAGFSTIAVTVALLSNTIVQDFDHYEFALTSGSTVVQTINTPDPSVIFQVNAAGTYTPSVRMVDKFDQKNTVVTGTPVTLDVLTIDQLRAETQYTDWLGTTASVLARLKDGVLYDGSGAYQFYGANAGWQWVEASRPLLDRYKTITFSAFWGSTLSFYFQVDTPTGTVYYAGPITISANGSYLMTRYTNQVTAQTNAYVFGSAGNGTKRFDFTQIEESRNIRLWFKDTAATFGLYEFYPRRLVQSDDIEAESIRSINIAALGINADRIFATTLSSIVAFIGQLNIDATGWLYQGTGTGSSPTTGLKIFNSGGIGKLSTYNSSVEQVTLDTDGALKAGAGNVIINAAGVTFAARTVAEYSGATTATNAIQWKISGTTIASIEAIRDLGSTDIIKINAPKVSLTGGQIFLTGTSAFLNVSSGDITLAAGTGNLTLQAGGTVIARGNSGGFYPGNQFSYYIRDAAVSPFFTSGILTNSNMIVQGNIYWGTGGNWLSAYLNQTVLTTSNVTHNTIIASNGTNTFGNIAVDYLPTTGNWSSGGTTLLVQGNDFSSIGFHDAGSRVDFIVGGGGILRLGYDGGWGAAVVTMPGGARIGPSGVYIGSTLTAPSYLIHLSADSAGKPTTSTWTVVSDGRSKHKVAKRSNALSRIKRLQIKDFEFNGEFGTEKNAKGVGVVAEELAVVYPESVKTIKHRKEDDTTEDVLAVDYHALFVDALAAIQELTIEVEALKNKVK